MTRIVRTNRARTTKALSVRVTPEVLGALVERLTDRDRAILALVWDHRVLTTSQLCRIFFPDVRRCRRRLQILHKMGALERRQPWSPVGTHELHWVLGPAGARALAAHRGIDVKALKYNRSQTLESLLSAQMAHQIGVNDFFARLSELARTRTRQTGAEGTELHRWWSQRECVKLCGDFAHPDASGWWKERQDDGRLAELDFFLEHDNGTCNLPKVVAKLSGYARLTESTDVRTPVLFWLPSARREANLRARLHDEPISRLVPIATAVHTNSHPNTATEDDGPAGPIWLPLHTTGPRLRLATLANAWGGYTSPTNPEGDGRE